MQPSARNKTELIGRLQTFLSSSDRGLEAQALIGKLGATGEVAIFGGMIRDFTRGGSESFDSDIDLVVDANPDELAVLLDGLRAKRNRFGGYRLTGQHVKFDVWTLSSTWAVKQGLVAATSLEDLIKTTFFDWDAAVYLPRNATLFCADDYFDRIRSGVVTINLEQNPNTLGAIARTLRLLLDWDVGLSQQLTHFLWAQFQTYNAEELVDAQKLTIGHVALRKKSMNSLRRRLSERDFFASDFRYVRKQPPALKA